MFFNILATERLTVYLVDNTNMWYKHGQILFNKTGDQGNTWHQFKITISHSSMYQVNKKIALQLNHQDFNKTKENFLNLNLKNYLTFLTCILIFYFLLVYVYINSDKEITNNEH